MLTRMENVRSKYFVLQCRSLSEFDVSSDIYSPPFIHSERAVIVPKFIVAKFSVAERINIFKFSEVFAPFGRFSEYSLNLNIAQTNMSERVLRVHTGVNR